MKATTIIRITGLTILMGLTSVEMANAQGNRGRATEQREGSNTRYRIQDQVNRKSVKVPTTVYKKSQTSQNRSNQGRARVSTQSHSQGHGSTKYKPVTYNKKQSYQKHHQTGSSHSTWHYDYNYNHHPVVVSHYHGQYKPVPQHRYPHFTVNLPSGFFGFHIDGVRYYHHNGYFYTRHPQHRGYVLTSLPKYFRHIPAGSIKIIIDGQVYFRYHNLFFRHTVFGFKLV